MLREQGDAGANFSGKWERQRCVDAQVDSCVGQQLSTGAIIVIALFLVGCNETRDQSKGPNVANNPYEFYEKKTREEMLARRKQEALSLLETAPTYSQPEPDSNIRFGYVNGSAVLTDSSTGDYCKLASGDPYSTAVGFWCYTKSGLLVVRYGIQVFGFSTGQPAVNPLRLFNTSESQNQSIEVRAARSRFSKQMLLKYLSVWWSNGNHSAPFLLIDAPLADGGRYL